ncbi:hypothetical protein [Victivallis sp. Marseille-Q1083]|uniref:hypothetical protein n=1 Tax=Victivallis sp. Marseille-Q1083 TaxID=2717288 RepID=UPI00158E1601|nr:hypothetical protein [Victivallis sp. Marseille-Q1083]
MLRKVFIMISCLLFSGIFSFVSAYEFVVTEERDQSTIDTMDTLEQRVNCGSSSLRVYLEFPKSTTDNTKGNDLNWVETNGVWQCTYFLTFFLPGLDQPYHNGKGGGYNSGRLVRHIYRFAVYAKYYDVIESQDPVLVREELMRFRYKDSPIEEGPHAPNKACGPHE